MSNGGIKMSLGNSRNQASSTRAMTSALINDINQAISKVQGIDNLDIEGKGAKSAKEFASVVIIPLLRASVILTEKISEDVSKLPNEYCTKVDHRDWSQQELQDRIDQIKNEIKKQHSLLAQASNLKDTKTASSIRKSADQGLENLNKQLEHYQKLLNHLKDFNSSSRSIFNNIEDITNKMNTGMQQFKNGYTKGSIVFTIPSAKKLSWTKSINKQYLRVTTLKNLDKLNTNVSSAASITGEVFKTTKKLTDNYEVKYHKKKINSLNKAKHYYKRKDISNLALKKATKYSSLEQKFSKYSYFADKISFVSNMISHLTAGKSIIGNVTKREQLGESNIEATTRTLGTFVADKLITKGADLAGEAIGRAIGMAIPIPGVDVVAGAVIGTVLGNAFTNMADKEMNKDID